MKVPTRDILAVFLVALAFFLLYTYMSHALPAKFTTPDETVTHHFISLFASQGNLSYSEPLHEISKGYMRPRNTVLVNGNVAPTGFLGIYLLYGSVERLLSGSSQFLTPFIAAATLFALYFLVAESFGRREALISALLLAALPPYWFWASMAHFNNIAASAFFVWGCIFYLRLLRNEDGEGNYAATASFYALASFMRYEFFIMSFLLYVYLIAKKRRVPDFTQLALSAAPFALVIAVIMAYNAQLYGSPFSLGYSPSEASESAFEFQQIQTKLIERAGFYLLPSGFHPQRALSNAYDYILLLLPYFSFAAAAGIYLCVRKGLSQNQRNFVTLLLITSAFLVIYYGGGIFFGYGASSPIMMSSYTRYLLPIYILLLPFCANFFAAFFRTNRVLGAIAIAAFVLNSASTVYTGNFGLLDIAGKRSNYVSVADQFLSATEDGSVLFSHYWDKVVFPERKVATYPLGGSREDNESSLSEALASLEDAGMEAYFMNDRQDYNVSKVDVMLREKGHALEPVRKIAGYMLYSVVPYGTSNQTG